MDITVTSRAARRARFAWITQVDEYETRSTCRCTRYSTDGDGVLQLLVDDDVVGPPNGESIKVTRQVGIAAESHRAGRVDVDELGHVEDLYTVVERLAADYDVFFIAAHLAPNDGVRLGIPGEAAEVDLVWYEYCQVPPGRSGQLLPICPQD